MGRSWAWPLVLAASACARAQPTPGESDFVAWAAQHAIALESLDLERIDASRFAGLDPLLAGRRIVLLGEPDHFIHEKNDYRLLLIRYLFSRGFRHVGMEMGHSDAWRMDRYLASGDEAELERIALWGYDGDQRSERVDGVQGFTVGADDELARRVNAESRWFLRELRSINADLAPGEARLHWFGYDVSFKPGGGYADAQQLLAAHGDDALVLEIARKLVQAPGESRADERERLDELAETLEQRRTDVASSLGPDDAFEVLRMVHNLADSLAWIEASERERGSPQWRAGLAERERCMMRSLDACLAHLPAGEKLILLGHNLHLSKNSTALDFGGEPMWPSLGTHLTAQHPGEVFGVWMLYDHGRHANPRAATVFEDVASRPGSLEHLLAQVGECFLLPLREAGAGAEFLDRTRAVMGDTQVRLREQTDAVFFVRSVREPAPR